MALKEEKQVGADPVRIGDTVVFELELVLAGTPELIGCLVAVTDEPGGPFGGVTFAKKAEHWFIVKSLTSTALFAKLGSASALRMTIAAGGKWKYIKEIVSKLSADHTFQFSDKSFLVAADWVDSAQVPPNHPAGTRAFEGVDIDKETPIRLLLSPSGNRALGRVTWETNTKVPNYFKKSPLIDSMIELFPKEPLPTPHDFYHVGD